MYNTTTRSFTMADPSGTYDWMVEGADPDLDMTDEEIGGWVDGLIITAKENAVWNLELAIPTLKFPRWGYTTADRYENADEYRAFKMAEIESDLNAERPHVIQFLKDWIAGE